MFIFKLSPTALSNGVPGPEIDCMMPWESRQRWKAFEVYWTPLVVMKDKTSIIRRVLVSDGLLDRIDRKLFRDALRHRPTDHLAREGVYHASQIEPSFLGGDVGDVAHPELILLPDRKHPLYDIQPWIARFHCLLLSALSRSTFGDKANAA